MDEFFEYWELIPAHLDYENIGKVSWPENSQLKLMSQLMCHRCVHSELVTIIANPIFRPIFASRRS
jgi:hypothetical protein